MTDNTKDKEINHDNNYFFTTGKSPYTRFKEGVEINRIVIIKGISVVFCNFEDDDGMTRVQWWAHYSSKWYGDFITMTDDYVSKEDILEACDTLECQAERTMKEIVK